MYKENATFLLEITEIPFKFVHIHGFVFANSHSFDSAVKVWFSLGSICSLQKNRIGTKKPPGEGPGGFCLSFRLKLLLFILEGIELIVLSLPRKKLLVIALLHDLSVGQEDDVVRMLDRRKPVGHDEHGADGLHLLQGILDQHLGLRVDIGSGLIQDHNSRLVENGSRKAE